MFIEKLASFAQEPQRAFTGHEIFLPGVGKRKPSLTPAHKQQIQMLFESGQGPAYRGSRELEMGRRSAERSRLRCGDEYSDAIEIGRFAHVQAGCAVVIKIGRASCRESGGAAGGRGGGSRKRIECGRGGRMA